MFMALDKMPAAGDYGTLLAQFLPLVVLIVVFYFVLIRPQRKKDKEAKAMLDNLKVGDRICTIGGIYGTIVRIKDDVLTIEVGEQKTQMVFARCQHQGRHAGHRVLERPHQAQDLPLGDPRQGSSGYRDR